MPTILLNPPNHPGRCRNNSRPLLPRGSTWWEIENIEHSQWYWKRLGLLELASIISATSEWCLITHVSSHLALSCSYTPECFSRFMDYHLSFFCCFGEALFFLFLAERINCKGKECEGKGGKRKEIRPQVKGGAWT